MPKLSQIADRRRTRATTVQIGDVSLQVTYRPDVVTPRFQKAVNAAGLAGDLDAALLWPVSELLASWDLVNDDGTAVPTTPEALADLPARVILAILQAITGDMAPNQERAPASSAGSSATDGSAPLPIGTQS